MAIDFFSTVDAKITEEVIKLAIYPVSIFAAGVGNDSRSVIGNVDNL